jgi:hypothetical protein
MSGGDGKKITELRPVPADIEAQHGPVVFQIRLFADGHLDWKSPHSPDPAMNEILFRGYFDKVRETILHFMTNPRIIT